MSCGTNQSSEAFLGEIPMVDYVLVAKERVLINISFMLMVSKVFFSDFEKLSDILCLFQLSL